MNPLRTIALLAATLPVAAHAHPGHADDSTAGSALLHVLTPDGAHLGGTVLLASLAAAVIWKTTAAARKRAARSTSGSRRSRT
jgi:hypothetical protein